MILADEETRQRYTESGVWGTVSLDAIFRKSAAAHPDRVAIVDAPDRTSWTSGSPQQLTYREADERINRIAALFSQMGLAPNHVIGLMLPNTADAVLTYLAAWRCGLVVAPFPLTWRKRSLQPALETIGAKAIVTQDRLEQNDLGTLMRDVAAEVFGIRYMLGFGKGLAEGILNIADVIGEFGDAPVSVDVQRGDHAADHVATLTFSATADGQIIPIPRSHNQWIATGLMTLLEARIENGSAFLSPFVLTGTAGLGGALVPWLLSSGTLHLHHFRSLNGFAAHASKVGPDHVLCPAALEGNVTERLDAAEVSATLLPVWPGTHARTVARPDGDRLVVDLTVLDELALFASRREAGAPVGLPLGPVTVPGGSQQSLTLLEISSNAVATGMSEKKETREVLCVRGPMAPARDTMASFVYVPTTKDGYLETTILARIVPGSTRRAVPEARAGRLLMVGGLPVGVNETDDAYTSHESVRDASLYVSDENAGISQLALAVVPEHAAPFTQAEAERVADAEGLAEHARPTRVTRAASLPRRLAGDLDEKAKKSA
ncbi:MAG: AMP-binding protein [Pseudomonadota bacterium]